MCQGEGGAGGCLGRAVGGLLTGGPLNYLYIDLNSVPGNERPEFLWPIRCPGYFRDMVRHLIVAYEGQGSYLWRSNYPAWQRPDPRSRFLPTHHSVHRLPQERDITDSLRAITPGMPSYSPPHYHLSSTGLRQDEPQSQEDGGD